MPHFLAPASLLNLLLIPALVVFFIWRERVRQKAIRQIGNTDLMPELDPPAEFRRRVLKTVLWLFAAVSLVIALARPVWGIDFDIVETQGASVMFVLDVSRSMDTQDVLPSRLERAKLSLEEMVKGLAGNELGVVLFARSAFVQFPLTTDMASAETFVKGVTTDSISQQGTDISAALRLALDSLNAAKSSRRTLVLMSDGENLQGDPLAIAAEAAQQDITIDTIGYGETTGAPIPIRNQHGQPTAYKSDSSGNLVLSALDEASLRAIAAQGGGFYQHASSNGAEALQIIDRINQGGTSTLDRSIQSHEVERFEIFVALALLAFSMEIGVFDRRWRATA
jgi:Ca-activated chloride channel family protein